MVHLDALSSVGHSANISWQILLNLGKTNTLYVRHAIPIKIVLHVIQPICEDIRV